MIWTTAVVTMVSTRRRGGGGAPVLTSAENQDLSGSGTPWEVAICLPFHGALGKFRLDTFHYLDTPGIRSMPACYYNPFSSSPGRRTSSVAHPAFVPAKWSLHMISL